MTRHWTLVMGNIWMNGRQQEELGPGRDIVIISCRTVAQVDMTVINITPLRLHRELIKHEATQGREGMLIKRMDEENVELKTQLILAWNSISPLKTDYSFDDLVFEEILFRWC